VAPDEAPARYAICTLAADPAREAAGAILRTPHSAARWWVPPSMASRP